MTVLKLLILAFLSVPLLQPTTSTPTPPSPIFPYTIEGLQSRYYPGGEIRIRSVLEVQPTFTRVYIDYPSDDLTISGTMNIPDGEGPFPVIILLHGYYDRESYWSGLGTWEAAAFFATQGYLTIAPDFRGWGESDAGNNIFATGLVIDTLHLISSLAYLPEADTSRIGVWGHSMGGGVATKTLAVDPRIRAAVLYAPNSADDADLISRWGAACRSGETQNSGDHCNPAEVILPDTDPELVAAYYMAAVDPTVLEQLAPLYHLDSITAPIQIHIGTTDGASLAQTPPEWSEKLFRGLEAANKEVTYWTYPGQGHFFRGEAWTLLMERALDLYQIYLQ